MLKVITLNLRNSSDRWEQRFPLVIQSLFEEAPDLIGFQEVFINVGGKNQAELIAQQLNNRLGKPFYKVYLAECRGELKNREAIAVLSRLPVLSANVIALPNIWRVAQNVQVQVNDRSVTLFNTHLHHESLSNEAIRYPQAQAVLEWMNTFEPPRILVGDMNASPCSSTIKLYKKSLISAYATYNGQEPDYTFPTPLTAQEQRTNRLSIDYIFSTKGAFSIRNCHLIGNRQLTDDPTLYPSDHFGILAEFDLCK